MSWSVRLCLQCFIFPSIPFNPTDSVCRTIQLTFVRRPSVLFSTPHIIVRILFHDHPTFHTCWTQGPRITSLQKRQEGRPQSEGVTSTYSPDLNSKLVPHRSSVYHGVPFVCVNEINCQFPLIRTGVDKVSLPRVLYGDTVCAIKLNFRILLPKQKQTGFGKQSDFCLEGFFLKISAFLTKGRWVESK